MPASTAVSSTLSGSPAAATGAPTTPSGAAGPVQPEPPLPVFPRPSSQDEPAAVLAAWTALEALSPQTYRRPEDLVAGDRSCVAYLTNDALPWVSGEMSRPKRQLYYQVVLGSVAMDRAIDELVKAFGEDEERSRREREKAPVAAVLLDRNGLVLEEGAVAVSSFAWALPDSDTEATEPVETWGLIAAVLGNATNRSAFRQNLWWHEDNALRLYLKAAKGDAIVREMKDPATGRVVRRQTPAIVVKEAPPTKAKAKEHWLKAKHRLLDLKRQVDADLHALEQIRQTCLQLAEARRALENDEARRAVSAATLTAATQAAKVLQEALTQAAAVQRAAAAVVQTQRRTRPGWLARLVRTPRWMEWARANQPLVTAERNAAVDLATATRKLEEADQACRLLSNHLKSVEASRRKVTQFEIAIDAKRMELGSRIVDDAFFDRGHEAWNLASPWLPDNLHRKREDLFIAAMAVHKAFIDASAQKVLHNLSVLLGSMSSGSFQDEAKRALLGNLWSTLFLVIPVVSTTFASVDRMLGDLPACSIGWLLVDEGGQALPQAAVGALMRAKRASSSGTRSKSRRLYRYRTG